MLEFLELNRLLGVSHFTFYNHTIGPKASCVLNHYMKGKIPEHLLVNLSRESFKTNVHDKNKENSTKDNSTTRTEHFPKITKVTVDMLPWNLKMKSQKEIRTEGLFASLNDCLYRSMYR